LKKPLLLFILLLITITALNAQTDTLLPRADTLRIDSIQQTDTGRGSTFNDSVSRRPITIGIVDTARKRFSVNESLVEQILKEHPYFGFRSSIKKKLAGGQVRNHQGKELFFYLIILLLIIYGLLQRLFPKYFNDLFRLFFRTTLKQRQIKEQLIQTPLPSLLLNGFFVISASLYLSFVLEHFHMNPVGNFWLLFLYCCAGVSLVYFIKFIGLKISGWLFNMEESAHAYIFIVFVVNKMIGILLLPFLVIIAFTTGDIYAIGFTLSWCLIGGLLIYRFILTYTAIRNQVKVNPFHFFLYLCAFEIAPLLLIYKALLLLFRISA
jgi:Domain of unknown function (DUF4271)